MVRKVSVIWLLVMILLVPTVVTAEQPVKLYLNHQELKDIRPILKSDLMYVPARSFLEALGHTVSYDPQEGLITAEREDSIMYFSPEADWFEYKGGIYSTINPIITIDGRSFIPVRVLGYILDYAVTYNKKDQEVYLLSYGYGETEAVHELLTNYARTYSLEYLSSTNLTRGYRTEPHEPFRHEIKQTKLEVVIDSLSFTSPTDARVTATTLDYTEVLETESINMYDLRKENGVWKIHAEGSQEQIMRLPADTDDRAADISNHHEAERNAILQAVSDYYTAYNAEQLDETLQHTSGLTILDMERWLYTSSYKEWVKNGFEFSDVRMKLSNERVIFLGEREAVVHATMDWSDLTTDIAEGEDVFEVLIHLDKEAQEWKYAFDRQSVRRNNNIETPHSHGSKDKSTIKNATGATRISVV